MQQSVLLLQVNDIIKCDSKANQCARARNVEKESMGWLDAEQNIRFSALFKLPPSKKKSIELKGCIHTYI